MKEGTRGEFKMCRRDQMKKVYGYPGGSKTRKRNSGKRTGLGPRLTLRRTGKKASGAYLGEGFLEHYEEEISGGGGVVVKQKKPKGHGLPWFVFPTRPAVMGDCYNYGKSWGGTVF